MKSRNDDLIKELQDLRITDPAEALRRVDELDQTSDGRATAAIVLIDSGDAVGDPASISRGVKILEDLSVDIGFDPNIAYNLANGLQLRARLSAVSQASFRGQAADDRFRARVLFGAVMDAPSASSATKSQMLTNIGILFLETHRWVEAIDCFQHAQRVLPSNAVAAFQEMRRLMSLASLFSQENDTYQSYCHIDALCQRVRHLASVISSNYDVVVDFAGTSALPVVQKAVAQALELGSSPHEHINSPYFSFVRQENIALSVHCSDREFSSGRFDLLTIPHVRTTLEDGPNIPEIFAMMNVMKADFAFARQVFFTVRDSDSETPFFETTSHADTLDYAVYGVRYSALTSAQRIAFDVLDKIAVAIACYLRMPNANKASFNGLWGTHHEKKGFVFSSIIEAELNGGNKPLVALFNIFQDISKHDSLGGGFMSALKQFRNSSTHRFTVLHDTSGTNPLTSSAVDHKRIDDFERLTLESLRLARAALFYFVDFIVCSEQRNSDQGRSIVLSSKVPDHDYMRGRRGY